MNKYELDHIRNFCIIAHIDHGKSTLADRILEKTGAVALRDMKSQFLDDLALERQRGITIKLNAVSINYRADNGEDYLFNLIDTPGHVDFSYEVSRSLAACEGALLIVDATQGVQAQTLANTYLAIENDLTLLPIINKIDLPTADIERAKEDLIGTLGIDPDDTIAISAKNGVNIEAVLEAIVNKLPAPGGDKNGKLKALVFDSKFDSYRGVIILMRIFEGTIKVGDKIKFMSTNKTYQVEEVGIRSPKELKTDELVAGKVGYFTAQIRDIKDVMVGDTVTLANDPASEAFPGFKKLTPMVYAGIYTSDNKDFENLRNALEKLALNDASLSYEPETSMALGSGFRCGFLGLLHMDVIQQRLESEYGLDIVCTAPSVVYQINMNDGRKIDLQNPSDFPDPSTIISTEEPFARAEIMVPNKYMGTVMTLCQRRRGVYIDTQYVDDQRVTLVYKMPLNEIIFSFFDRLKSLTAGYASLGYELIGYEVSDVVRMDILLNLEPIDALTMVVFRESAYHKGRQIVDKLKDVIPRQQFQIPIQAVIGGKILARADIKAVRKDVLSKCYGGDITRKKKLLEAQKQGKKRMKKFGKVSVPQGAFIALLSIDD